MRRSGGEGERGRETARKRGEGRGGEVREIGGGQKGGTIGRRRGDWGIGGDDG